MLYGWTWFSFVLHCGFGSLISMLLLTHNPSKTSTHKSLCNRIENRTDVNWVVFILLGCCLSVFIICIVNYGAMKSIKSAVTMPFSRTWRLKIRWRRYAGRIDADVNRVLYKLTPALWFVRTTNMLIPNLRLDFHVWKDHRCSITRAKNHTASHSTKQQFGKCQQITQSVWVCVCTVLITWLNGSASIVYCP